MKKKKETKLNMMKKLKIEKGSDKRKKEQIIKY